MLTHMANNVFQMPPIAIIYLHMHTETFLHEAFREPAAEQKLQLLVRNGNSQLVAEESCRGVRTWQNSCAAISMWEITEYKLESKQDLDGVFAMLWRNICYWFFGASREV